MEHVLQDESGNAVFKYINTSVLIKLKHLVYGFQHGFNVFVVVPCEELFHGFHVVVLPYSLAQLVDFGRDVLILQSAEKGFVRWQLDDVQFVQGRHPLVREGPFLFCTLLGFQVLAIAKALGKIIGDIDKHQLLCLDTHEIVIPFHVYLIL